jgi:hypothetical protein
MKKIQTIICLVYTATVGVLLTSCYPGNGVYDPYIVDESRQKENFYYAPAAQNAPLLSKKNELSLALNYSSNDKHEGTDLHAAFTPGKHFGLMSGFSFLKARQNDFVDINHFELGGGYFKKFSPYWHFETYGGLGTGKTKNFFVQPAIAVTNPKNTLQFAFVSKISMNHFRITDTSFNNDREPFVTSQMKIMNDQPSQIFWEPALVLRTGWENILFQVSYSISTDLTNSDLYRSKNNFSIGIVLKGNVSKK